MGGAQKHMLHPYDDLDLTFGDWFKIAHNFYRGGNFQEKLDGCNLTWRWNGKEFLVARNWSHFRTGGQSVSDYREYLSGHPAEKQFVKALDNLESLKENVEALDYYERLGDKIWVNMEVIDKDAPQMIKYDHDAFAIHNLCTFVDGKSPYVKTVTRDIHGDFVVLQRWAKILSLSGIRVIHHSIVSLPQVGNYYWRWVGKMTNLLKDVDVSLGDNIRGYFYRRAFKELSSYGVRKQDAIKLAENIAQVRSHKIQDIRKNYSGATLDKINEIALSKNRTKTFNLLMKEMKDLWLWFGAQRLDGVTSTLIDNHSVAQNRIQRLMNWNVYQCGNVHVTTHPNVWAGVSKNLDKFVSLGVSPQVIEGFVVDHMDRRYKLTGAFQSLNQICGAARYQLQCKMPDNWQYEDTV